MHRFLCMLIASTVLCFATGIIWMTVTVGVTGFLTGDHTRVETVGYTGLVVTVIAGGIAWLNGLILGAISPQGALLRRLLWHLLVYFGLAVAWTAYIVWSTAPAQ